MTKSGLIIPLWLVLVSGCAISNDSERALEKKEVSTPAFNNVAQPSPVESLVVEPAPVVAVRTPSQEEIRQLQTRLRDIGLDPGPADGLFGEKTKLAFARLQAGCARLQPMIDSMEQRGFVPAAKAKSPSSQEVLALQTRLRSAGFNPGPADGVWGAKSSTALSQAQTGCALNKNFAGLLERPAGTTAKRTLFAQESDRTTLATTIPTAAGTESRLEALKTAVPRTPARSPEEVRILQLRLRDAGYDPGPFDGVMGPKTKLALEQLEASQRNGKSKTSLTVGITDQY